MARTTRSKAPPSKSIEDESIDEPANTINPYTVLALDKSAAQDQIKTAYRKAALKHHPDKVKAEDKDEANKQFQEIATAYAILSDEKRRRRYDTTGSTSESLDDEDFDWADFFRAQSEAVLNGDVIEQIKREYQGSEEEREDVVRAYQDGKGDMDTVYEVIMCSNVVDDDRRFRSYIDEAIEAGTVKEYQSYVGESKEMRRERVKTAKREELEAMELAEELGVKEKLFGKAEKGRKPGKKTGEDETTLMALIQQRQKERSDNFFDQLESKYGGKKSKRKANDEPPEELFQKNSKKTKAKK